MNRNELAAHIADAATRTLGRTDIIRDREWGEWTVRCWDQDGRRWEGADYHTEDRKDAVATEAAMWTHQAASLPGRTGRVAESLALADELCDRAGISRADRADVPAAINAAIDRQGAARAAK